MRKCEKGLFLMAAVILSFSLPAYGGKTRSGGSCAQAAYQIGKFATVNPSSVQDRQEDTAVGMDASRQEGVNY